MRLPQFIICLAVMPLAACATVDLADMTPAAREAAVPAPENVVIKTSAALTEKFEKKGWSAAPDPNRVQKAASFLLRGIKKETDVKDVSYAGRAVSTMQVKSDVKVAVQDVQQLVKAADVYLAVADTGQNLRTELKSLEKALAVSHRAEMAFEDAFKALGADEPEAHIKDLTEAAHQLRDLTNIYGERVRAQSARLFEAAS